MQKYPTNLVYFVRINDGYETYYKIGVTSYDLHKRLTGKNLQVEVLDSICVDCRLGAEFIEKYVLFTYKEFKKEGVKTLRTQRGYTELFHTYVLDCETLEDIAIKLGVDFKNPIKESIPAYRGMKWFK